MIDIRRLAFVELTAVEAQLNPNPASWWPPFGFRKSCDKIQFDRSFRLIVNSFVMFISAHVVNTDINS